MFAVHNLNNDDMLLLFCLAETGVPVQSLQFVLAAWATFMACTAVDKLVGKKSGSKSTGKTTKSKTVKQSVVEKVL